MLPESPIFKGRRKLMTYVMTKPCPVCKQQLTKKGAYRYRAVLLR
jgi:hypothetical protein